MRRSQIYWLGGGLFHWLRRRMSKASGGSIGSGMWPVWVSLDSDNSLPPLPNQTPIPKWRRNRKSRGPVLFNGQPLMCACPDCGAPMAVRSWLMSAQCWRCGTTIEISDEWLSEFQLETAKTRTLVDASATPPPAPPTADQPATPRPPAAPATEAIETLVGDPWIYATLRRVFRDTPAWIVSLLLHLIALTLLGLLSFANPESLFITLSTLVSRAQSEGARLENPFPEAPLEFDMPIPTNLDLEDPADREKAVRAKEDAKELQEDPNTPDPQRADLTTVRQQLNMAGDMRWALSARDPRIRSELVSKEGGTMMTEASVARGLRWLAKQQRKDGSWRLQGYDSDGSTVESSTSATSMALLAFLGAGQTHLHGKYRNEVSQGLVWLLQIQSKDGDTRGRERSNPSMYGHAQASIALCEAFLMTGDEELRDPAQRSIDFVVEAQYDDGGWRYSPHNPARPTEGDTSVTGWYLMALQSARAARLDVPAETMELAGQFLDQVQSSQGARYAYLPSRRRDASPTMTAEALLSRVYLGWGHDQYGLRNGVAYLIDDHPPTMNTPNIYYWYYATQLMHHYGGEPWKAWNKRMSDILVRTQLVRGKHAGSWEPRGPFSGSGGRLYVTSLSVCTLEVYYRHLPLFRPIDIDETAE